MAPSGSPEVIVVGGGVIGLTTAVALAESGTAVRVVSADPWAQTTSRVAGAVWEPYLCGGPDVLRWAGVTYDVLQTLAETGVPGVQMAPLVAGGMHPVVVPGWARLAGARPLAISERLAGWVDGFCCTVPLIDMGRYLPYLADRLASAGGSIELRRLGGLGDLAPAAAVVNCSGFGARLLAGDATLEPVRGQLVVVDNPGLSGATLVDDPTGANGDEATYAIAHSGEVVLGGTAQRGATSLEPDERTAAGILARARRLLPALEAAPVIEHRVGLRPWRPTVRLDVDAHPQDGIGRVVHNYGHGGAGVTLSWGCALDAAQLLGRTGLA